MLQKIKEYVQSMGVTDLFYQQMINTEPSDIRLYRGQDFDKVVPPTDPTYDEIITSYQARRHGIDTGEMRQRDQEAKDKCYPLLVANQQDIHRYSLCVEAVQWGLSERVYEEREKKRSQLCKWSDEDQKAVVEADRRSKRDLPALLKLEACVRNVMLGH